MERIYAFLPSVLIIACIAGTAFLYLKWVVKRFGDNLKSVEWHRKNQGKVAWTVGTPMICVFGPAVEELIFRAPLIIAFGSMSSSAAWYGVFASSGLFALSHWFGKKIWMPEILSAKENGDHESDDVEEEINRLHQENEKGIMVRRVLHVVLTLPLGVLAGYYGIRYQSVWVAFGIHMAWNLVMPFVVPLFFLFSMLAFFSISSLWNRVMRRRRRLW